ncbi:MAG: hypothetical protein PHX26_09825, partial [Proteiniphilum sp.]|nr:hypothetical protein [Proteiniphilum sp.]
MERISIFSEESSMIEIISEEVPVGSSEKVSSFRSYFQMIPLFEPNHKKIVIFCNNLKFYYTINVIEPKKL